MSDYMSIQRRKRKTDNKSILLVDDNTNLTKTMAFILKRKGFSVTTAKNGLEAVNKVKEQSFNLIFMDIKMPHMNGVEAYKRIKKISPKTTVMMMTAYAVEDLVEEAIQEGASGIIYKPLDLDNVISLVHEVTTA